MPNIVPSCATQVIQSFSLGHTPGILYVMYVIEHAMTEKWERDKIVKTQIWSLKCG